MKNAMLIVGAGVLVLAVGWWFLAHEKKVTNTHTDTPATTTSAQNSLSENETSGSQGAAIGEENLVTFNCNAGKTITAVFERDIVALTLSDGRQMTLRQADSGSGVRYFSNDGQIEFSGGGTVGALKERGVTLYGNCVAR